MNRLNAELSAPRLAFVLWNGVLGGAETFTAALARALRHKGVDARVVFVGDPSPLEQRLRASGVPYETLGLSRGRSVVLHPRRFAGTTMRAGADGAILIDGGYLPATLRLGGYGGRIIVVEHGSLLLVHRMRRHRRIIHTLARRAGERVVDAHVAVSDFMSSQVGNGARPLVTIPNAVDLDLYRPMRSAGWPGAHELVVGCMARLVAGKGVDDLLNAAAEVRTERIRIRIAGDGPERAALEALARHLELTPRVDFLGWVGDADAFWKSCDVAVVPSHQWIETFGLTAAEAMASGCPVIATRNGGLSEVVDHDVTGFVVDIGDTPAIAEALRTYACDRSLLAAHGAAARLRCEQRFDLRQCADAYLALFEKQIPA
jgi:glycosyltransferase involved in cell wall biosynthesis